MARRRQHAALQHEPEPLADPSRQHGALPAARGRDRAGGRVPPAREPPARVGAGPDGRVPPPPGQGADHRPPVRGDRARRDPAAPSAGRHARRAGSGLESRGRPRRPDERDAGPREGRPRPGRARPPPHARHRRRADPGRGVARHHGPGRLPRRDRRERRGDVGAGDRRSWSGLDLPIVPMEHQYLVTEAIPEVAALGRELPLLREVDVSYYLRQEAHGPPPRALRARGQALRRGRHPAGVRRRPPAAGPRAAPDDRRSRDGACARPRAGGHPADRQRPDHLHARRESARRPRVRAARLLARLRAAASGSPRRAGSGSTWRSGSWRASRPSISGSWTRGATVRTRPSGTRSPAASTSTRTSTRSSYPQDDRRPGRPARTSPLYDRFRAQGAVFGVRNGWERPYWFAPPGTEPRDRPSFRRTQLVRRGRPGGARGPRARGDPRAVELLEVRGPGAGRGGLARPALREPAAAARPDRPLPAPHRARARSSATSPSRGSSPSASSS